MKNRRFFCKLETKSSSLPGSRTGLSCDRPAYEGSVPVFPAHDPGQFLPAIVQYRGFGHRRPLCGRNSPGRRGGLLCPHHGFHQHCHRRRRRGFGDRQPVFRCLRVRPHEAGHLHRLPDLPGAKHPAGDFRLCRQQPDHDLAEDPGGQSGHGRGLPADLLPGPALPFYVQHPFRHLQCPRQIPVSPVFPDFLLPAQRVPGHLHGTEPGLGCGRGRLGHPDQPEAFGGAVLRGVHAPDP